MTKLSFLKRRPIATKIRIYCKAISTDSKPLIVDLRHANIYPYGRTKDSEAVLRDVSWTVNQDEKWAIISSSNSLRGEIFQALLGNRRIDPISSNGIFPFLNVDHAGIQNHDAVLHVSFASRGRIIGGGFTDYSARYGAMREEDKQTLRETLLLSLSIDPPPPPSTEFTESDVQAIKEESAKLHNADIEALAESLRLSPQLDVPFVGLSNGQRRRARILRQILRHPRLILLEDPFAGLDATQRPLLSSLLRQLHDNEDPLIILELRPQDPLPEWVTHVALLENSTLRVISPKEYTKVYQEKHIESLSPSKSEIKRLNAAEILSLKRVQVQYSNRQVLRDITWTINSGDRWHLKGANGSGKTTLLSMITGEHPQSFTQTNLKIFGQPRVKVPTVSLQQKIGIYSPEIFYAFPRRRGPEALTVADAVGTGFAGTYSYRKLLPEQKSQRDIIISKLAPGETEEQKQAWSSLLFADLPPSEQGLALLMRALVNSAPLLILDEVFSGMDEGTIMRASEFLRTGLGDHQAVIFVSHWEQEVPWKHVQRFVIESGIGRIQ